MWSINVRERVIRPTKIVVLKELTSLGIRVQQIIAGNSYAMWRVLLPSPEDAVALTKTPLETKTIFSRWSTWGDEGPW